MIEILAGKGSDEPGCLLEKLGVGILNSRLLLARHGMACEEPVRRVFSKHAAGVGENFLFRAANISKKSFCRQRGPQQVDESDDCSDWSGEHNDLAAANGIDGIH